MSDLPDSVLNMLNYSRSTCVSVNSLKLVIKIVLVREITDGAQIKIVTLATFPTHTKYIVLLTYITHDP